MNVSLLIVDVWELLCLTPINFPLSLTYQLYFILYNTFQSQVNRKTLCKFMIQFRREIQYKLYYTKSDGAIHCLGYIDLEILKILSVSKVK